MQSAEGMGMAASRAEERIMCAFGLSGTAPVEFESCQTIALGGVLMLLPFLLECNLMSYRNHYSQRQKGYYNFDNLLIIIAFLFLCRIKNFEQLKLHSPGELGKLVGYDRVPEVRKFRELVNEITSQNCANKWSAALAKTFIDQEQPEFYYVDGHVQVYHGYLANLGKKYVSRQRLCLPGVMEFWVNGADGKPYFYITAEFNEKMIEMLTNEIVPHLLKLHPVSDDHKKLMQADEDEPLFTLVFDREAYSPKFFAMLWTKHRIAIISYRKKQGKDYQRWDEKLFKPYDVPTILDNEEMMLHEENYCTKKGYSMREVRKLCDNGHQTSIVTTNKKLTIISIASGMFARWTQENFFGYMRKDYSFDKIIQYSIDEIDKDLMMVNKDYTKINDQIKKEREKLGRQTTDLYHLIEKEPLDDDNQKENQNLIKKQLKQKEVIARTEQKIEELIAKRKNTPYKISNGKLPAKHHKLHRESKLVMNIIKIICFRAETALAALLKPQYKRAEDEIRMLVKSIINSPIDMVVDYKNELLQITLYPLSNQRSNEAVSKICETINQTNTIYPGTNLKLIYKIRTADIDSS